MTPAQLRHLAAGLEEFAAEYGDRPGIRHALAVVKTRHRIEQNELDADLADDDPYAWAAESGVPTC